MKEQIMFALLILALLLTLGAFAVYAFSQSGFLVVEAEQHWETYGVGGTCIPATHNLVLTDADGDNITEIVTGGYTYNLANGTRTEPAAPLKIWNWSGQTLTLEKSYNWSSSGSAIVICVYAGDANLDGETEIITAGGVVNQTGSYAQIRFWQWDGETLTMKTNYEHPAERLSFSSVFISDVDKDKTPEILVCGRSFSDDDHSKAMLSVWHWDGANLTLKNKVEWCTAKEASANSVYASDVDADGTIEIITGGYDNGLDSSTGQIRIWHWNGNKLSLEAQKEWRLKDSGYGSTITGDVMGNTIVNNLKVGDVDCDGDQEIVTGGFTYDGYKVDAQLAVWNYSSQTFGLEKSQEWTNMDISEVKSVSLNDVDSDGQIEIVTSGVTAAQGSFAENATDKENAQLRIWNWDGKNLTLKQFKDWTIGEGVCAWNVGTGDVDRDGTVEIVTVGCMYVSNMCDPDMRIWSIATPLQIEFIIAAGVSVAAIFMASVYLFGERERK